ncbi:unnamed protein product, partial [Prorocentrum cordatum]
RWVRWHGSALEGYGPRAAQLAERSSALVDPSLCLGAGQILRVEFVASGPGRCFRLFAVGEAVRFVDDVSASAAGLNAKEPAWIRSTGVAPEAWGWFRDDAIPWSFEARECIGFGFAPTSDADDSCRVPFSRAAGGRRVVRFSGMDLEDESLLRGGQEYTKWESTRVHAVRVLWANLTERSVASLDEALADGVDAEFEQLRRAVHLRGSLVHPSVAQRAARASELLAGVEGAMAALMVLFFTLVQHDAPRGREEDHRRWTARFDHLVGLAACVAAAAACGSGAPPQWAADVLGLALNLWANVWALPEHSAWGLGFWDVRLLAAG